MMWCSGKQACFAWPAATQRLCWSHVCTCVHVLVMYVCAWLSLLAGQLNISSPSLDPDLLLAACYRTQRLEAGAIQMQANEQKQRATRCVMALEGFLKSETSHRRNRLKTMCTGSCCTLLLRWDHSESTLLCMHVGIYFARYTCCSSSSHWSLSDWTCSFCPSAARQDSYLQSSSPESPGVYYISVKLCNGLLHS